MPWELDGNAGIDADDDFLGTRNNAPLIIKTNTNNVPGNLEEVLRVTPSTPTRRGRVGIATTNPAQQVTVGAGNVQLPTAQGGTDGNLYLGGRTDNAETGLRLFGGVVNGQIPGGFIDVRTIASAPGRGIRYNTPNGGTVQQKSTATAN